MTKKTRGKSRKGGFFELFKDKDNDYNGQCNPNNLNNLTSTYDIKKKIDTCCPKSWYGRKNNSPYCKQLNLNYDAARTQMYLKAQQSNANGVYIDNDDPDGLRDSDVAHLQGALYQHNTVGDDQINCKDKNFAQSLTNQEKMEKYIEACECNKTRWNPFSDKKANCAIVKPKLEKLQAEERPTEVFNPIQQNNQYMPVGQSDNDNEAEAQERPTEVSNPYPKNEYVQPQEQPEDQNQRPSLYSPEGGKRRKTKKHFNKRSIRKRKGRKSRKY